MNEPSLMSTRIALLTIFITSLLVVSMYNASLTSFLAVHRTTAPFEDIQGLYLHSNYKVAITANSFAVQMLRTGDVISQKIYNERLLFVNNVEEGLKKALEGDVAFLKSHPAVYAQVGHTCTHAQIAKHFYTANIGWLMKKDFPYAGFINH